MSSINVLNIIVQNSSARFLDELKFEIVFECLSELKNGKIKQLIIFNRHRMASDLHWER